MKFLILARQVPSPVSLKALYEITKAEDEWAKRFRAAGSLKDIYVFPSGGGMLIVDCDSAEALLEIVHSCPDRFRQNFEVIPLADWDAVIAGALQGMEAQLQRD